MKNELGREIPQEKVREIARRIAKLPKRKIDKLFKKIGFIVHEYKGKERPEGYKALLPEQIEEIKKNKGKSVMVKNLLLESHFRRVVGKLEEIE